MTMRDRVKELRRVPASELLANPKNWRIHPEAQRAALRGVLEEIGFADAMIARETPDGLELIDGHLRRDVMGDQEVPVLVVDVTAEEAEKMLLTFDPLSMMAHADTDQLLSLLADNPFESQAVRDMLEALANGERDVMPDLSEPVEDPGPEIDRADELREKWQTERGQVWEVGRHRLMCGDATVTEDVSIAMDGTYACLMITDPPYGVAYHANKKGTKASSIEGDLTQAAIPLSFAVAIDSALDDNARLYLFGGTANWPMYSKLFDHFLRMQPRPMIWVKETFVLHPTHYHSQYETVFFGWKGSGGGRGFWFGDRTQSDVWDVRRDNNKDRVHPTQKPVDVVSIPVSRSAPLNGIVYDPFVGSGTTIIAAERLGRRCYAMEIEPRYCDVAIKRWEDYTGEKAVKV